MKGTTQTHWLRTTLIVLIVLGLIGTALAAVMFTREKARTSASATLQLSFSGSAEGRAPNGDPFDMTGITTDEVLNAALEAAGLSGSYTAAQLRENLIVTGVYPENIVKRMTEYVSLLDANTELQSTLSDYHATQYTVRLYNDFDTGLSGVKLTGLLDEILAVFRNWFAKHYTPAAMVNHTAEELATYDYSQQLEMLKEDSSQQQRYADELETLAKDFRYGSEKTTFADLGVKYQSLDSEIDRLSATITLNALSTDRERLQKRYEMEIRNQQYRLTSLTEELTQIGEQVDAYEKEGIIYVSAGGTLREAGGNTKKTYDQLVAKRKAVTDEIAAINAKIALYEARLADMSETGTAAGKTTGTTEETADGDGDTAETAGTAETAEETADQMIRMTEEEQEQLRASVEAGLQSVITRKATIDGEFAGMLKAYSEQEINTRTVSAAGAKVQKASLLSGAFAMRALRTAGPLCAVGFMVCIALLIISRLKEEKQRKGA